MITSPRVLDFELYIVDFAIRLLERHGEILLLKRSSLEQDREEQARVGPSNWALFSVLQANITSKEIFHDHIKLLQVLQAILQRVKLLPFSQISKPSDTGFSRATFSRVEGLEDSDSDDIVFKRRMGMRIYFKQLKMHLIQITVSKAAKA